MNAVEQKAHRVVTTQIAQDLQALAEEWAMNFQTFTDRLDLHRLEISATHRTILAFRLEVDRLEEEIRKLKLNLMTHTLPLRLPFWGRVRWFFYGDE